MKKIDGKKIAHRMRDDMVACIVNQGLSLRMVVVYVGSDPAIDQFVGIKQRFGKRIGVEVDVVRIPASVAQGNLVQQVASIVDQNPDGLIIQLPLPDHIDRDTIIDMVPPGMDVDGMHFERRVHDGVLPPVAGAVQVIVDQHSIDLNNKNILIIGEGRLVGSPVIAWLRSQGCEPGVIHRETPDDQQQAMIAEAEMIVSGIGVPHSIQPDMIQDGAVLIDAGTSESGKKVVGDINPECYGKASLYTPVPGGVGPLTVAVLFRNLLLLNEQKD